MKELTRNKAILSRTDFDAAQAMIDGIKKIVEQRETSWALNRIREQSLRCSVDNLERENTLLRAYIQAKDLEIEALETDANILEQHVIHNCLLRKLLIKFEKKVRLVIEKPFFFCFGAN